MKYSDWNQYQLPIGTGTSMQYEFALIAGQIQMSCVK